MAKKPLNPIDKHVGSRVRMRRMMLGMSQTKLGDALGITFQQVQKNEKGTNRIAASRLQHISHILQVPVSFFFDGGPTLPAVPVRKGAAPSPSYVSDFRRTGAYQSVHANQGSRAPALHRQAGPADRRQ